MNLNICCKILSKIEQRKSLNALEFHPLRIDIVSDFKTIASEYLLPFINI